MALVRSTQAQLWSISKIQRNLSISGWRNYSSDAEFKSILDRIGDNLNQGMGGNAVKGETSTVKWDSDSSQKSSPRYQGSGSQGGYGNRGYGNQGGYKQGGYQGGYKQGGGGFDQGGKWGQAPQGQGFGGGRFGQPGGGGGFGGGRFGDGFGGRSQMPKLNALDWNGVNLAKVTKNCYKEDPSVANMPQEDITKFRESAKITTKGNDVPNPVFEFDKTSFPQEIIDILKSEYKNPTAIQSQGWPVALSGRDMVGSSQTGSGKTIGFTLPALVHIMTQLAHTPHKWTDGPIALILAPTRELAVQIHDEARAFLPRLGLRATAIYGGAPKPPQTLQLKQGPHLVIATPGRLIDMLEEGHTNLRRCTYIVLDEADRMLDMGFEPQIRSVLSQIRPDRQTLMWSATWPDKVQRLASEFFTNPVTIHVGSTELSANPNVKQHVHVVEGIQKDEKILTLVKQLVEENLKSRILIFAGTQGGADRLCYGLQSEGIRSVGSIHGGKQQNARQQVLGMFRSGRMNILVATDVAARGLDIDDVTHVINYDFPKQIEDYIHRIGRTGRAGRSGTSHSFFTPDMLSLKLLPELMDVMRSANQEVPPEIQQLHQQTFALNRGGRFGGGRFGSGFGGNNRFGGSSNSGGGYGNRKFGGDRDRFGGDRGGDRDRFGGNRGGDRDRFGGSNRFNNNNNTFGKTQQETQPKEQSTQRDNNFGRRDNFESRGKPSKSSDDFDDDLFGEDFEEKSSGRSSRR